MYLERILYKIGYEKIFNGDKENNEINRKYKKCIKIIDL